jgi:hypothetical protein
MSSEEHRGPEPTPGGDSERGVVDPGLAVERDPALGPPEAHPEAEPAAGEGSAAVQGVARSPRGASGVGAAGGAPGPSSDPPPQTSEPDRTV